MDYKWRNCWILLTAFIKDVAAYEVCRKIKGVTVTFCQDGYHCCENDTQCCQKGWNPLAIAALVLGCIIGVGFIVATVILCIKRNNQNKSRQLGASTQEIEMAYTGDLPPPYLAYLETNYAAADSADYLGLPPPYQPTTENTNSHDTDMGASVDADCQRTESSDVAVTVTGAAEGQQETIKQSTDEVPDECYGEYPDTPQQDCSEKSQNVVTKQCSGEYPDTPVEESLDVTLETKSDNSEETSNHNGTCIKGKFKSDSSSSHIESACETIQRIGDENIQEMKSGEQETRIRNREQKDDDVEESSEGKRKIYE